MEGLQLKIVFQFDDSERNALLFPSANFFGGRENESDRDEKYF